MTPVAAETFNSAGAPVPLRATSPLLRPLDEALDYREAGGKAATLSRLSRHGIAVPRGMVLTTAAFALWLDHSGLQAESEAVTNSTSAADPERLRIVGQAFRNRALTSPMPADVDRALDVAFETLSRDVPLVVRSSAVGEDGRHASFAGQLDSVPHVRSRADLGHAVRRCWASAWSDRALSYCRARNTALDRVAVIIQRQVAPAIAGVLFTRDPQAPSSIVVEYCHGLADGLVSGVDDPYRVRVRREDVESGRPVDLPPAMAAAGLLPVALGLERVLDGPQDIEWAVDESGALWIVQARPITTVPAARSEPSSPTYWSNANVNENFPRPISPLLYSIASTGYSHYFRNLGLAFGVSRRRIRAMDDALRGIIGVHGARMYYNLTNIHAVLRMAPCGDALGQAFNRFTGAGETAPSPTGAVGWQRSRVAQGLELARIAVATTWQYLFLRRRVEGFEREADHFAADTRREHLANATRPELAAHFARFIDIRQHRWKNASLADAAAMVSYALLERTTRRLHTTSGDTSLHNRLLRALPGVPSGQPPLRLWALARMIRQDADLADVFRCGDAARTLHLIRTDVRFTAFRDAFNRYLDEWGFRSSEELMLTVPTLEEDPRPIVALLTRHAAEDDGESPEAAMARQAAARVAETRGVLRHLALRAPHRAIALWATLAATRRAITYRERARLKQALLYTRCRAVVREIGRRLEASGHLTQADDVFMLRWEEIAEQLSGRAMFPDAVKALVRLRSDEHARLSAWMPPDAFVLERGEHWRPDKNATSPIAATHTGAPAEEHSQLLHGTSACGGVVTARAAVLAGIDEAHRLEKGDVLVTRQTDPGWAPVFCLIGGLVIERGGMLSHGAIIAREFGLPCVVGVRDATRRIRHGHAVTVDGNAGTCLIDSVAPEVAR